MDPLLIGAGVVVGLLVIAYLYFNRTRVVSVYHVGAVQERKDLLGKKILLYGFVKPVYGRAVKIVGLSGSIKGRSEIIPEGGNVLEGTMTREGFVVERVVKQLPGNWKIDWVNPAGLEKVNKPPYQ